MDSLLGGVGVDRAVYCGAIYPRDRDVDLVFELSGYPISSRAAYAAVAALGMVGLAVVYFVDPRIQGNYPICPFFGLTGFHCPGCGTLRALHMLLRGDVVAALGYNPFAMLALPFVAYSYIAEAMRAFRLPTLPRVFLPHQWIWALLIGVIAFWALRNIPAEPFSVLAP